jgi:hypothetical protein
MENNFDFSNFSVMDHLSTELGREKIKVNILQYIVIVSCAIGLGALTLHIIYRIQNEAKKNTNNSGNMQWN